MQHLIARHKQKKSIVLAGQEDLPFHLLFEQSEDTLTSMVFSRLCYLPSALLWAVLTKAANQPSQTACSPGRLTEYFFWPHWDATGSTNTRFTEPDVFLRFERLDVLVEAKKDDSDGLQNSAQHDKEINSYYNVYGHEQKPAVLLAVGGIGYNSRFHHSRMPIWTVQWKDIHFQVQHVLNDIRRQDNTCHEGVPAICQDLDMAFSLHGFFTGKLLNSLPEQRIIFENFPLDL